MASKTVDEIPGATSTAEVRKHTGPLGGTSFTVRDKETGKTKTGRIGRLDDAVDTAKKKVKAKK